MALDDVVEVNGNVIEYPTESSSKMPGRGRRSYKKEGSMENKESKGKKEKKGKSSSKFKRFSRFSKKSVKRGFKGSKTAVKRTSKHLTYTHKLATKPRKAPDREFSLE